MENGTTHRPENGTARRPLRALVIQHEQSAPGGYLSDWLQARGAEQDVVRIDLDGRELVPGEYDLIVTLGSEVSASDDSVPWLARELGLLRAAVRGDVPVLAICFGVQALSRALGGRAMRSEQPEIGWLEVRTSEPRLVAPGPWLLWHFDTFDPPPGARLIADSLAGPQAYTIGRSLGVQFHPEVTPEIAAGWAAHAHGTLEAHGVDPDELLDQTRAMAEKSRAAAWELFDHFLETTLT
jgi:GMP synthase (glutamine-hydrolysing)